jgi:hypothetical protein
LISSALLESAISWSIFARLRSGGISNRGCFLLIPTLDLGVSDHRRGEELCLILIDTGRESIGAYLAIGVQPWLGGGDFGGEAGVGAGGNRKEASGRGNRLLLCSVTGLPLMVGSGGDIAVEKFFQTVRCGEKAGAILPNESLRSSAVFVGHIIPKAMFAVVLTLGFTLVRLT